LLILTTGVASGHGEFVDGDIEILVPSDGPGKWPQDVQPPNSE
jgi:hypothetical protein